MNKSQAEQVLGLKESYSYKELCAAYRRMVKTCHPDAGGTNEVMSEVNSAKEYLDTYFESDKNVVIKCSVGDVRSQVYGALFSSETQRSTSQEQEDAASCQQEPSAAQDDFWNRKGFSFTENDYSSKSQSIWTAQDWDDFKYFRVPSKYRTDDFVSYIKFGIGVQQKDFRPHPRTGCPIGAWDIDNLDTQRWDIRDWYFFWFANTQANRVKNGELLKVWEKWECPDGYVLVHDTTLREVSWHLHGPHAQRERACEQPDWEARQQAYFGLWEYEDSWDKYVYTGDAVFSHLNNNTRTKDRLYVAIPYAFSDWNYDKWRTANEKAFPDVELPDDWGGLEFLREEDFDAPWIVELGLQDEVGAIRKLREAKKVQDASDGFAQSTWIAQHQGLASWIFVVLVYIFLPSLSAALCMGLFGSVEAAMVPAFAIQIAGLVAAIVFRKRVIRWFRTVQRQVFGKA